VVARHGVHRRGEQVCQRRLEALVGAAEQPALGGRHARRARVDALIDRQHLLVNEVLVEHGDAAVLYDRLHVVVVGRLVDERPDREPRRRGDRGEDERGELHRDEQAKNTHRCQRPKNARSDSAIQSIIGSVRPG
jgi:hypothetical protein